MWFKQLNWYKRIGVKISVLTSVLAIGFLSVHTYFSIQYYREELIEEVIRSVSLLSDTIKASSRADMLLYAPDRLHQTVDNIGKQPSIQKMRIFNYMGEIIYSSDRSEMNRLVDKQAEQCYACHSAQKPLERLGTSERTRIFTAPSGKRVLGMINPIYNEPDCSNASCHVHPADQKVLGVMDIDVSLEPIDERIRAAEAKLLSIGLASAVALAALIMFLINRFLNQPLKTLIEGTRRVANDDLDVQIPIRSDDELAIFGRSFNQMTQDLKRAKDSLTQWGCRLEQMVCERTKDLQETQQQLIRSEKLASLGKLSAGVAHEINNPLTGILNLSQLLMDEFPEESEAHQDLKLIVRETIRCRGIVRGLLDFARQTAPEKASIEINGVIQEILQIVTNQESFQNIRVETLYDPEIPRIMADLDQLKQVFFNVIVNASEAMGGNGELKIVTRWEQDRSRIAVHCIDNGPGISEKNLNRLFDPFFTTKEMGTGLGLAISYGIIRAHRGNIEVRSKLGEGCEMIITLPAEPHEVLETPEPLEASV
ncbi:MAG: HAMP domain-containing protein [Syntrophobacteraceae bacterium]|nr:HAMP domain-containing protein [Syntrophobacteraceae bacterium]